MDTVTGRPIGIVSRGELLACELITAAPTDSAAERLEPGWLRRRTEPLAS